MQFSDLGLLPELQRAVAARGYTVPTPVQAQAIPLILAGRDLLAGAQTGTGKTAGFTLPLLQRLHATPRAVASAAPRALVLTPTRELTAQVAESVRAYGQHLSLRSAVVFGGVGINGQIEQLRRGVDVLIATPGRLLDHVAQRTVDLSHIEIFVLDEADRMLDMGFIHDIKRVIRVLPKARQNLLFSATYSDDIRHLAQGLLNNAAEVEVARRNTAVETVTQAAYEVAKETKRALLSHLIRANDWQQVLVFTRTKHGANRLTKQLQDDGISAAAIHGNKSQSARVSALSGFKTGSVRALVATEVAARGLDIKELPHVVNYELPNVPEDYVHRIGRTGRAGASGQAVSLVAADESKLLKDIEKLIRQRLERLPVPNPLMPTPAPAASTVGEHRHGLAGARQAHHPRQDGRHASRSGADRSRAHQSGAGHAGTAPSRPGQPARGQQRGTQRSGRPAPNQSSADRANAPHSGGGRRPSYNSTRTP